MSRIVLPGELRQREPSQRFSSTERQYMDFLHRPGMACCLTGYTPFDIAHTGGAGEGKGMGRKSNLETCLPLRRELHAVEEKNRAKFWPAVGFKDHLAWAERLYDQFEQDEFHEAELIIQEMNATADKSAIRHILTTGKLP